MKREDVKAKLPGITDEQLNWLMSENGADINREKTVAEQFKTQFENAQAQLKTAQDGLAKFDGKKTPDEYEAELTKLRGDMQAQADGFAFDSALNTAIMGKKGRSVKAVRACWTWRPSSPPKTAPPTSTRLWKKPRRLTPGLSARPRRAAASTFPAVQSTALRPPATPMLSPQPSRQ